MSRSWAISGTPPSRPPLRLVRGGRACPSDDELAAVYGREWSEYLGAQLEIRRMSYEQWRSQALIVDGIARRVLPRRDGR